MCWGRKIETKGVRMSDGDAMNTALRDRVLRRIRANGESTEPSAKMRRMTDNKIESQESFNVHW